MKVVKMILKRIIPFYISLFIVITILGLLELKYIADTMLYIDGVRLYTDSNISITFLVPYLLIPAIYGYIYYSDKKNNFCDYIGLRVSIKEYRLKLVIIAFLSCFLLMFLKERIIFNTAVMLRGNIISAENTSIPQILVGISSGSPYWDSVIFSSWKAFSLSLHAVCAVVLSFNIRHFFVIVTGGLVYRFATDLVGTLTPFFDYISLISAEGINSFTNSTIYSRISGFTFYIVFIILVNFIGSTKRKKELI